MPLSISHWCQCHFHSVISHSPGTLVWLFAHISSYFQFLGRKYGAKPFGTLSPGTYILRKYVCGSFSFFAMSWETKKEWKITLSYHFHSNVTQVVMNGAQREIKGMWRFFKEISIASSRLLCTGSVFYIGQVLPRNTKRAEEEILQFIRRWTGLEMVRKRQCVWVR